MVIRNTLFPQLDTSNENLTFAGKAWSLPIDRTPIMCSTRVGSILACKVQSGARVTDCDKRASLLCKDYQIPVKKFL